MQVTVIAEWNWVPDTQAFSLGRFLAYGQLDEKLEKSPLEGGLSGALGYLQSRWRPAMRVAQPHRPSGPVYTAA